MEGKQGGGGNLGGGGISRWRERKVEEEDLGEGGRLRWREPWIYK